MDKGRNPWVIFARYANLAFSFGVTMAAMLFLGFYGGRWLDRRLGTEPFFMIAGVLLGAGLAFKSLLDELGVLSRESKREENGEQKQRRNGY